MDAVTPRLSKTLSLGSTDPRLCYQNHLVLLNALGRGHASAKEAGGAGCWVDQFESVIHASFLVALAKEFS